MLSTDPILRAIDDGVLTLTLNRPQRRNAMNGPMYVALARALTESDADDAVRAIVICGANGYFTAGNDLEDFVPTPSELIAMRFLHALAACRKPVLAAVEGGAIGVGTTLLLSCDFAFAGESTVFSAPFVKLGVCAEGASSVLLPQLAGYKRAAAILLLGEPFGTPRAVEAGIVTASVADGSALEKAMATARQLAALSPGAVQTTKALMRRADRTVVLEALDVEARAFLELLASDASQRAIEAFVAGRSRSRGAA